jgi:hypothetical protein
MQSFPNEDTSTRGRDEKCIQYFGWENLKESDHSEGLGVDRRTILEWIIGKQGGKV